MRGLRNLLGCDRGASVIEMGLLAPILATLLVGIIDLSRAYSERLFIEQAAQRTIEKVAQQRNVSTDYSTLATEAAQAAQITQTSSNPLVDYWLECSSDNGVTWTRQGNGSPGNGFNGQCPNASDIPARYVTVTIQKNFTPMFSTRFFPGANNDGTVPLRAEAGIRVQ